MPPTLAKETTLDALCSTTKHIANNFVKNDIVACVSTEMHVSGQNNQSADCHR